MTCNVFSDTLNPAQSQSKLLHSTRAVGVSQTLRRGTANGITELSILVILNRGCHLYSEGGHHAGHRPTFSVIFTLLKADLCGFDTSGQ